MVNFKEAITKISNSEAAQLQDMYDAVTMTPDGWKWLGQVDETFSFMLCSHPTMTKIIDNMKLADYHSGASMSIGLRHMEYIAKNTWEKYVESRNQDTS
jgi:hypothetical protein